MEIRASLPMSFFYFVHLNMCAVCGFDCVHDVNEAMVRCACVGLVARAHHIANRHDTSTPPMYSKPILYHPTPTEFRTVIANVIVPSTKRPSSCDISPEYWNFSVQIQFRFSLDKRKWKKNHLLNRKISTIWFLAIDLIDSFIWSKLSNHSGISNRMLFVCVDDLSVKNE